MKNILCLLALIFSLQALGQSEPITRIKGLDSTKYNVSPSLVVPNSQVTKLSSSSNLIETGNRELLANPSFEGRTVAEGWTVTNATPTINTTDVMDGKKSLSLALSGLLNVTQETTNNIANRASSGQSGEFTILVKSALPDVSACAVNNGVEIACVDYDGSDSWKKLKIRASFLSPSTGIKVKTKTSTTGTVLIDDASVNDKPQVTGLAGWKQYDISSYVSGTNWGSSGSTAVPYKTLDGEWRLKFNVNGLLSASASTIVLTYSGVTFSSNANQAVTVFANGGDGTGGGRVNANTSAITLYFNSASTSIQASGDVALDSMPTWAQDYSNMVLSEDAGNRRITVYGDGNNGISVDSSTDITFTEVEDTTSSWSGSSLTAPESGDYLVFGSVNTTSGTFNSYIRAYINGNADKVLYRGNSSIGTAAFAGLVSLQKDQVLSIRTSGAFTLLNESKFHWISITKLASPQTIAASEVQSGFANTDGVATGSFGSGFVKAIKWDNIIDDTHSALNTTTGIITSRRNGKLTLNISSMWTSSTAWSEGGRSDIYIYVGGVQVKSKLEEVYYATASDATYVTVETSLIGYPVKIGDEIYVNIQQTSGAALSLFPSPTYNTIGWEIK